VIVSPWLSPADEVRHMDTNYFLKREQVSLVMAAKAASPEARHAHNGLARLYGKMLREMNFPHRPFSQA
jgi:hypothetical protein